MVISTIPRILELGCFELSLKPHFTNKTQMRNIEDALYMWCAKKGDWAAL